MSKEEIKKAVALRYDTTREKAPRVVAKGKGEVAAQIIKTAKAHDLPIKEDADLVELLSKIELEREIPENLYKAVAELFSFIYQLTKKIP